MNFTSRYTDNWRLVNDLTIVWPWPQQEIYSALEQEEYIGDDRAYCSSPKSPILAELLGNVATEIPKLLLEMSDQDQFKVDTWHLEYNEQLLNNTKVSCTFLRDAPGFTTKIHIDSRMTVCTGMLFFNSYDDADQSTTFYTSVTGDDPVRISSEYGKGWYSANTSYGFHCGSNNSLRNRYTVLFRNILNLK
jgi:hypothetical protein